MGTLIYVTNMSLDGFIEDEHGRFDWGQPDEELHAYFADLLRPVGTYVYGRRLYETMAVWETDPALAAQSDLLRDFADVWKAADKVVCSATLPAAYTERTRLVRHFDPAAIRDLKARATSDLVVGGADLAGQAWAAGLVDECQLFVWPVVLAAGKPALPPVTPGGLELLDELRFGCGVVRLRYRVA